MNNENNIIFSIIIIVLACIAAAFWWTSEGYKGQITQLENKNIDLNAENNKLAGDVLISNRIQETMSKSWSLKAFSSMDELNTFLKNDETHIKYGNNSWFTVDVNNTDTEENNTRASITLMIAAREQGYWMGLMPKPNQVTYWNPYSPSPYQNPNYPNRNNNSNNWPRTYRSDPNTPWIYEANDNTWLDDWKNNVYSNTSNYWNSQVSNNSFRVLNVVIMGEHDIYTIDPRTDEITKAGTLSANFSDYSSRDLPDGGYDPWTDSLIDFITPFKDTEKKTDTMDPIINFTQREINYVSHISDTGRVTILNNPDAKDVSYNELLKFLMEDQTDKLEYVEGVFSCPDFAEILQHNAEKKGINCGWVYVNVMEVTDHSLNAFMTTDKGLIFVDVSGVVAGITHPYNMDKTVILNKGSGYCAVSLFPESGWTSKWNCTGTIVDYQIYWEGDL